MHLNATLDLKHDSATSCSIWAQYSAPCTTDGVWVDRLNAFVCEHRLDAAACELRLSGSDGITVCATFVELLVVTGQALLYVLSQLFVKLLVLPEQAGMQDRQQHLRM